jgi:hypothetical protein
MLETTAKAGYLPFKMTIKILFNKYGSRYPALMRPVRLKKLLLFYHA